MSEKENRKRLSNLFHIGVKGDIKSPIPTKSKDGEDDVDKTYIPINLPTNVKNFFNYLVDNQNTGIYRANQFRLTRYRDMKYAVTTEPLLTSAVRTYVSECYNPQDGKKPIEIHAKNKKVEDCFYKWIQDVGLTDSLVRSDIQNLVMYGDSFWSNDIDLKGNEGVIGITPIDPFLIKNRMEINAGMVEEMKSWGTSFINTVQTTKALNDIYKQMIGDISGLSYSDMLKSYCLGYEVKLSSNENSTEVGVAPWYISHARLFTTETDFFPFGKPMLLSALPAFKSYRTTQMLVDMLRVASFPREHVKIKGEEGMDTFTRMERVDEVRMALEGMTKNNSGDNELSSVGERVYSIEDLFELDILDSDIDLDKLGDLEYKRNDMVGSTGIPRIYIDTSSDDYDLGSESGEALKFLCKVFSRNLEQIREAELENISNTFRMHLMLTHTGDEENEEFELSMPNAIEDYNSDEISRISDTFSLAKDIIDAIGSCAGLERGETIDKNVVKSVLRKYLPIEASEIEKWINSIYKDAEEQAENQSTDEEGGNQPENVIGKKGNFFDESKRRRIEEVINSDEMNKIYLETKIKNGIIGGDLGNRTYFNNSYTFKRDKGNSVNLLSEQLKNDKMKTIKERKINS